MGKMCNSHHGTMLKNGPKIFKTLLLYLRSLEKKYRLAAIGRGLERDAPHTIWKQMRKNKPYNLNHVLLRTRIK